MSEFLFIVIQLWNGEIIGEYTGSWDQCCDQVRERKYWETFEISVYKLDPSDCPEKGGTYELIDYVADDLFYSFDNYLLSVMCGVDDSAIAD